jgi:hypothetical protein
MGFQLTNLSNYEQAVTLLKNRFGQTHKVINAHMQALLDIRSPNGQLSSIESGGSRAGGAGGALSTTHDVIRHLIYSHSR